MSPSPKGRIWAALLAAATWSCGGAESADKTGENAPPSADATQHSRPGASGVATISWPKDPCSWITVAEAEAILGPLTGPPRQEQGGCLYPVQEDSSPSAIRARETARKVQELGEEMAKRTGEKITAPAQWGPAEPAVIVDVSIGGGGELGLKAAESAVSEWAGVNAAPEEPDSSQFPGWDFARAPIALGLPGFLGRVGQLSVTVRAQATPLNVASFSAMAAAVRDRVPEGPFTDPSREPLDNPGTPLGPDPCALLAQAEAEAVLGSLVVPPYRGDKTGPFHDPAGPTCVYHTARHRAFRLTPTYSGGASQLKLMRGLSEFLGAVVPPGESADTLEGSWDDIASDPGTGDLVLLVGDRALQVSHSASSTDAAGAIRLAGIALKRLAAPNAASVLGSVASPDARGQSITTQSAGPAPVAGSRRSLPLPFDVRYLPLVILVWMLIAIGPFLVLIGRRSGWRRLADLYPARSSRGESFRSGMMVMNKTVYRGGVRLTADESHLHFAMPAFARPGHPPFSIPWSELAMSPDEWPWFPLKGRPLVRLTPAKHPDLRILAQVRDGERIAAASGGRLHLA